MISKITWCPKKRHPRINVISERGLSIENVIPKRTLSQKYRLRNNVISEITISQAPSPKKRYLQKCYLRKSVISKRELSPKTLYPKTSFPKERYIRNSAISEKTSSPKTWCPKQRFPRKTSSPNERYPRKNFISERKLFPKKRYVRKNGGGGGFLLPTINESIVDS